jgi:modification methylase
LLKTSHTIIIGDARDMREVADESIHLIVTSPPYWQLKDYGTSLQIGFHDTYEEYINNLNLVWKESFRVLHPGCRLCINVGDQFARGVYYGRYKVIPIRTEIIKFCEVIGFDYMGAIIWQKVTTCRTSGGASIMGSYPYPRSGVVKLDYEFILLFRKNGDPPPVDRGAKEKSRLTKEEWNQFFTGHWNFPGEKQEGQSAVFPEELPRRLIRMFSFVGDTVMDPFLGSGTTTLAAKNAGRSSIGYEINDHFLPLIKQKLGTDTLIQDADYTILHRQPTPGLFEEDIERLPYVFRDPVRISRSACKTRPIPGLAPHQFLSVKSIISPEQLLLSDGTMVRLLGVQEEPAQREAAIAFLLNLTKGQRVYVRLEESQPAGAYPQPCYLYLKNRTFINAHLIKSGLVDVDAETKYGSRERFLRYHRKVAKGPKAV